MAALTRGTKKRRPLEYAGQVGFGFTAKAAGELAESLKSLQPAKSPVTNGSPPQSNWVKPTLKVEVRYSTQSKKAHGGMRPSGESLNSMAKKKIAKPMSESAKPAKKKASQKLSDRAESVLSFVLTSIAFETHSKDGDLDSIAEHLGVDPKRLRTTLKKMEEQDVITVEGSGEFVYPTTKTLRKQMPEMSLAGAEKLLKKLRRG